jgi:tryptophanyl-tRNA synthetase
MTDPARKTRNDPGNPEVCNIYSLHRHFSPPETVTVVAEKCRSAGWGCIDCKRVLADNLNAALAPIQERAKGWQEQPGMVEAVLADGAGKARQLAQETMHGVRERMGFLPRGG